MNKFTRVVVITGCSSGIGRAAAFHFARHGWAVVGTVREQFQLYSLSAELHQASLHTSLVLCDVTREDDVVQLVSHAIERFGRVDVLINNAGFARSGGLELVTMDEARAQVEVNTLAPIRLTQLLLPHWRKQGGGRVINISSVAGRVTLPWNGWYSASKFALEALTDALRLELRPFKIDVVSVLAGPVLTKFVSNVKLTEPPTDAPEIYRRIHDFAQIRRAAPRPGAWTAERCAALLYEIATVTRPRTRYVTGAKAQMAILLRKLLPDRLWDRLLLRAYGVSSLLTKRTA